MNLFISLTLFLQFTSPCETRVFINLESNSIIYARFYQDNLIGIDSVVAISEHLEKGLLSHNKKQLLTELKREMTKKGGYASKGLIGTFEIPLPKGGFSDFMGETGKLDVGGHVKITLGGSETFITDYTRTERPSLFPELEMKQEMSINLDGQVGDRMRVFIDHNSERIDETQNKITITYKGKEDEILQEIEGGDTQLSIPATTYTGDIPSHRGLFGIKSTAKLGPLDLVAIASQEQTQAQEFVIEGAVRSDTGIIGDRYYERRRFFWLGTNDSIIYLEVYVDDGNTQNNNNTVTHYGDAILDADDDNIPDDTTKTEKGYFTKKLQGSTDDYLFIPNVNIIELATNLQLNTEILGVYYIKRLGDGTVDTVGMRPQLPPGDTAIHLKLICPRNFDTASVTWDYELKNYYQVTSPGSRLDSLRIYYRETGGRVTDIDDGTGKTFLQVLGLDQNNDGFPDENMVYFPGRGLLIFPDPQPFASGSLADPDSEIYTNLYIQGEPKYYIYKKTIEAKPVYDLPPNVIKVLVWVDGIPLDSTQYYVDYEEGKLEFKTPIPATAKIRIKTEYSPLFSLSQKSLVGMRGSMKAFGEGTWGFSFLFRSESYPVEHVRLQEEPFSRMVLETDFSLPKTLPILTDFIDMLPLIETDAESKLNLNFEGAYSFSNANSRGEAYLDDLESSTISEDVPVNGASWVFCSTPAGLDTSWFAHQKLIWYNPWDKSRLSARDIYKEPLDPNEIADVLQVIFNPDDTLSFAGITQYINGQNLDECENLELILKGKGGRIHVDIAQNINEDQLRRNDQGSLVGFGSLEDEDRLPPRGTWTLNIEDAGLDGVFGDDDANISGDDGNDDYYSYDDEPEKAAAGGLNGTEGNGRWDTEDIDRNGILDQRNAYHGYSVNLDGTTYLDNTGLKEGWKMFRIPIKDSTVWDTTVGQPDWHNIRYVRVWFDGFSIPETLLIYKLSATGSRWKNYGITGDTTTIDTTEKFTITPINNKTHSYYKSPYPPERDPVTGQIKQEGALEFRLENIKEGHTCVAHRNTDENEDYRAYDTLTFFLRANHSNPIIFVRIGSNDSAYYEYTTEYEKGPKGFAINDYRLFKISLFNFIKLKKESGGNGVITDGNYTVVNNPSLSVNRFFEIQIKNQFSTPLTDTIWFNDMKLVSPKKEVGRILRSNGSLSLADFSTLTFAFDESNGRFKRLSDTKEISVNGPGRSYLVGTNISLNKLLPNDWNFSIPLGLRYSKSIQEPRFSYLANDLELTRTDREKEKETGISKSYTLHISKFNSKNWFLKQTLDRLSFSQDHSWSFYQKALSCDTSEGKSYNASYSLNPTVSFKIFNQIFSLLPQNSIFSAAYSDNFVKSYYRRTPDTSFVLQTLQHRKALNPSFSTSYSPHEIMNTSFNFSQSRDSVSQRRRFGEEVSRNQSFNANISKNLKIISPSLSYNSSYSEDHRFEIRMEDDYRNVSNSSRYSINGTVDIKRITKFFTQLRDESKDSLLIPGSPLWVVKQVEQFVGYLQNPSITYARQRNSSYLNVKKRPDIKYQWGIVDSIPTKDVAANSFPGRGMSDNYGITSGLSYKFMGMQFGYSGQVSRTFNYDGSEIRNTSRNYPDMTLRLSGLERLPYLKKYTHSSSLNSTFSQTIEQRYTITTADSLPNLDSDSRTIRFSPLLSWMANWVRGISTTTDINYSETKSNQYSVINPVPSRSLSRGGAFSLAYSFSAPRGINLPFMGGIKFASNLAVSLSINYTRNTSYSSEPQPTNDTSIYGVNVGVSYNFSTSITGGANFDYSQNKEANSNMDSKSVGVNIWTNINF